MVDIKQIWNQAGAGGLFSPIPAAGWLKRAGGQSVALSDDTVGGTLIDFGATTGVATTGPFPFVYKALPTSPWKSRHMIRSTFLPDENRGVGVAVSDGTKLRIFLYLYSQVTVAESLAVYGCSSENANPTIAGPAFGPLVSGHRYPGLGIRCDGTNLIYEVSENGLQWTTVFSEAASAYFASAVAITQAGIVGDVGAARNFLQEHVYASVPFSYIGT